MRKPWRDVGIVLTTFSVVSALANAFLFSTMGAHELSADKGYTETKIFASAALAAMGLIIIFLRWTPAGEKESEGTAKSTLAVLMTALGLLAGANSAAALITFRATVAGAALAASIVVVATGVYMLPRGKLVTMGTQRN